MLAQLDWVFRMVAGLPSAPRETVVGGMVSESAAVLRPGMATGVGSLPHGDISAAIDLVLQLHPELPAAPQLPQRSAREFMLAQAADGLCGVTASAAGISFDPDAVDPEAEVETDFSGDAWLSLSTFFDAVADRRQPIKLQVCGPVSLGFALVHAGMPRTLAGQVASRAVIDRITALLAEARHRVPHAPLVLFLDEPSLTAWYGEGFPWEADDTVDLLSGALAAAAHGATTGVHCCGATEWRLALAAGPDVLSVPAGSGLTEDPVALGSFLEAGGWLAWGAVPTDGPVSRQPERYLHAVRDEWHDLARGGVDMELLRDRALVTPACGLAGHTIGQAEEILTMSARIGSALRAQSDERVQFGA